MAETPKFPFNAIRSGNTSAWSKLCLRVALVMITLILVAPDSGWTQDELQAQMKAEFIERFTRLIEWPAGSSVSDTSTPFVIGVIGDSSIRGALENLSKRARIKGKAVEVKALEGTNQTGGCQILFISGSTADQLGTTLQSIKNKPILTIGDTAGFAKKGVMINFVMAEGYIRFQINQHAANKAGLTMTTALLGLGETVE